MTGWRGVRAGRYAVFAVSGVLLASIALVEAALAGITERVSVSSTGEQVNVGAGHPSVSGDGRFVAFSSAATNLVAGDTNGLSDVFVRDRLTGTTEIASVSSGGQQGNGLSLEPCISADGRFVAFQSSASNLVAERTQGMQIFVRDRLEITTEVVSLSSQGQQVRLDCSHPAISADGRFVAFQSFEPELVPGDTNGRMDIFVRDRVMETTERVSVSSAGGEANSSCFDAAISGDGRFVAFDSMATNLVPEDTSPDSDVFVHDRDTGITERVSVSSIGQQPNGSSEAASISADGRFVAFHSAASNLVPGDTGVWKDVFVRDRLSGTTEMVSASSGGQQGNSTSWFASISGDGRFIAFESDGWNLVPGDTNLKKDAFIHDRLTGATERVSVSSAGRQANGDSSGVDISGDGNVVAFWSSATTLVVGDTNKAADVFVHDRAFPTPPGMLINAGAACTNTTAVTLSINCEDWTEVRFRNDPDEWDTWEPCASAKEWTLNPGDGMQTVCVQGRDALMRESVDACGEILLDTTPPQSMSITINDGAECTDSNVVRLSMTATDAVRMRFRNEQGTWSPWYYFTSILSYWGLSPGSGRKAVYFQALDACGNESAAVSDEITLPSFDDAPCGHSQMTYIEALVREGITSGCATNPPLYCPTASITRAQMAVFIIRAMGETPYNSPTPTFTDVPASHWAYGHIERMHQLGITGGCSTSPMRYCPDASVSRSQMAVFLCRAAGKTPLNSPTPTFTDVPPSASFYGYVERLADASSWGGTTVTSGCAASPPSYCPYSLNTRGQMAVFLVRAFEMPM